jgi:AcrR family transcriptional regulator
MQKALIRDEAHALFSKISFAKTSVADIAKACGLGKGTIYLYFKSKDEIVLAIIEDRIARLEESDTAFFGDPEVSTREKVQHFFECAVEETFALKNLIFGPFENVQGKMFRDIFFKYGRYYDWCIEKLAKILVMNDAFSRRPAERVREDAKALVELIVGRMLLFLIGRDWNDEEGLKAIVGPLSIRLYESMIAPAAER